MRVELLYFDGCPNWDATRDKLQAVLSEMGLRQQIQLVRVPDEATAQRLDFPGSPTVRVNGKDVEPSPPEGRPGLGCRVYWSKGRMQGTPEREWLISALRDAVKDEKEES